MARSTVFRAGRVMAYDSKWTGEEPDWHDWEKLTVPQFLNRRGKMLDFYNYYLGSKELKPFIVEWMKKNGYDEKAVKAIENGPDWLITQTAGKLCRAILRGMPAKHPKTDIDDGDFIRGHVDAAIAVSLAEYNQEKDTAVVSTEPVVSPRDRLIAKVSSQIFDPIDVMIDAWSKAGDTKVEPIDMRNLLKEKEIPGNGCPIVIERLKKLRKEFTDCVDKIDDQAIASYAHLSKRAINSRMSAIDTMIGEVEKLFHTAKAARKPRIKKEKSADKQVARLKFMSSSKDYGIESVTPVKAVGASRIVVFNTKYRDLIVYNTDKHTGLTFKGSAVKDWDESSSFMIKLRKPNDVLPKILGASVKNFDKVIEAINAPKRKPNGRFNEALVIVSVYT